MIDESKRWPESFPDRWASEWGEDEYGLWMAFHYKQLRHVLRWIEPGVFMMGSPKDEPERESWGADETLHQVTLTEGFWLGATTVTQELWEGVTGENPSEFKGDERPVEQVSWDDAQKFMAQLNKEIPGLDLVLPTEAQWEYACRAGTTENGTGRESGALPQLLRHPFKKTAHLLRPMGIRADNQGG